MRRLISSIVVICTSILLAPAYTHSVNSSSGTITQNQPSPELSLCSLSQDIKLYQNKVVRVRVTIVGMGGHYPFFVTANGCNSNELIMLRVKFHERKRTEAILQKRLAEVLSFNLAGGDQTAEAVIVGRVTTRSCKGCSVPQLLISVMDVELKMPELDGRA